MRIFLPAIRADLAIGDSYILRAVHPALREVPALILAGAQDPIAIEEVFAWTDLFAAGRTMTLGGDHFFIHSNPAFAQVLKELCQQLCTARSVDATKQ
jgi:surfactin synthase thioesterase subunit